MKTILVSLISEQTIPNVLLIKELQNIDGHIFVTTEKMEEDEKKCRSDWIIKAANLEPEQVQRIVVNQDSLTDIENKLATQVKTTGEMHFIINLTGGNKLMSLAAYQFFSQCQNNKIYYIPVGPRITSYEGIFPNGLREKYELTYRVNLIEYLTAYGVELKKKPKQLVKSEMDTRNCYSAYTQLDEKELSVFDELREYRKKGVDMNKLNGLKPLLAKMMFRSSKPEKLDKDETKYLTGDWFEEYVYMLIKKFLSLDDSCIWTGISVEINGQENELDVLFIKSNKLYLIECKTSVFDKKTEKNIFTETAYKAAALRREFGLNVETMIFTLTSRGDKKENVREIERKRAELLGIRYIFDGSLLENEQKLKEELQKILKEELQKI